MPPRLLTLDTPAGRIGFREAGTGTDVLVLLHGLGGNSLSWESQFDHLANHRSEEHTSELQSLMRISYAVFCLKKKNKTQITNNKVQKNKRNTSKNMIKNIN